MVKSDSDIQNMETASVISLGKPVPVESITRALKELWSANSTHTRCSLINLVVYCEQPNSLEHNATLIREITFDHACRALIIDVERSPASQAARVEAWITAHCHLDQAGGKSMCSEQIAFRLNGDPAKLVPNTVFAHLDSDLPLIFWWQGSFSDSFERHLTSRIDRLVIDSASWDDPKQEFRKLQQKRGGGGAGFVVMDLVSTRLFAHRLALAACFDTPEAVAGIDRIREITIHHSNDQRLTAMTFIAWMAHRANWQMLPARMSDSLELKTVCNESIIVDFTAHDDASCHTGVSRVTLTGDGIRVSLDMDCSGRYIQSRVTIGKHSPVSYLTPAAVRCEASLVSQRLRQPANDALYFRIWEALLPCF